MNHFASISLLLVAAAASNVHAFEPGDTVIPASTMTRAEVRAELNRARAGGELAGVLADQHPFAVASGPRAVDNVAKPSTREVLIAAFNPLYVGG